MIVVTREQALGRLPTVLLTLWALGGLATAIAAAVTFQPLWWISAAATAVVTLSGLLLAPYREQRLTGHMLLGAAGASNLVNLRFWSGPDNILGEVAFVSQWLPTPMMAVAFLTYPAGSPLSASARRFYIGAWIWALAPRLVGALLSTSDPGQPRIGWWGFVNIPGLLETMVWVEAVSSFGLAVWATVLFAARWRHARGTARALTRVMAVAGILVSWGVVAREVGWMLFACGRIPRSSWDRVGDVHQLVLMASIFTIAGTILASMARRGPLTERLLATGGDPLSVRTVLREELVDPSVELYFRVEDRWLAADGAVSLPPVGADRDLVTLAMIDDRPSVLVALDPSDKLDPGRRRVALAASGVVLNAAALAIERDAYVTELAASRGRIAAAAEAQRRGLERTLHDGIQQGLLAATATLSRVKLAARRGDWSQANASIDEGHAQILEALAELRRLARGIYPAALAESGLVGGVQSLVQHWPNVHLIIHEPAAGYHDLAPDHASLIYFAVAEGLANAHKYGAEPVSITLDQDAETVSGQVTDGGPGGARFSRGGGLAGLRDRVEGLGGSITLTSPRGGSTAIKVVLPRQSSPA